MISENGRRLGSKGCKFNLAKTKVTVSGSTTKDGLSNVRYAT